MAATDWGRRLEELRRERVPFVRATVVLAERPTSARPGDQALVLSDGSIEGFVGGSCAETSVRAQSLAVLAESRPQLLRISPESEPAQPGRVQVVNPCLSGGTLEIFLEPWKPPPLLAVLGETPIGRALFELAGPLGFEAVAWGSLPELPAAVVVASHGRGEEEVLRAALSSGVPYVGLVASRRRGAAVRESLQLDSELSKQLRTPAGLDIGATTPAEVALSILAEIIASRPRVAREPAAAASAPVLARDPVCGMEVASVEASLNSDHEGVRWWFCGPGCRDAFQADPSRYAPA